EDIVYPRPAQQREFLSPRRLRAEVTDRDLRQHERRVRDDRPRKVVARKVELIVRWGVPDLRRRYVCMWVARAPHQRAERRPPALVGVYVREPVLEPRG